MTFGKPMGQWSADELRRMVNAVHLRLCEHFPLLVVNGAWRYRGFDTEEVGGFGRVVILRFERDIRGRTAFIEVQITEWSFNNPLFDMRAFIIEKVSEEDRKLTEERTKQLDCAA